MFSSLFKYFLLGTFTLAEIEIDKNRWIVNGGWMGEYINRQTDKEKERTDSHSIFTARCERQPAVGSSGLNARWSKGRVIELNFLS